MNTYLPETSGSLQELCTGSPLALAGKCCPGEPASLYSNSRPSQAGHRQNEASSWGDWWVGERSGG